MNIHSLRVMTHYPSLLSPFPFRLALALCCFWPTAYCFSASPRVVLPGEAEGARASRQLAEADQLLRNKQWAEGIEEYQRIIDEAGNELVPLFPQLDKDNVDRDKQVLVQVRYKCHERLAGLPPEALGKYRERMDGQAKKWFEQGKADRDPRLLRRVVENAFCSRWGDQALDLLGDLEFERGHFEEADRYWCVLSPRRTKEKKGLVLGASSLVLSFPDPQVDLARAEAKIILARLFGGERQNIHEALKDFRALHGKAEGMLAGHQGNYADTLQSLIQQPDWPRQPMEFEGWATFAGDPARAFISPRSPRLPFESKPWSVSLEDPPAKPEPPAKNVKALLDSPPVLAHHPAVVGNLVLIADAFTVTAYDLLTGQRRGRFDLIEDGKMGEVNFDAKAALKQGARYTLTVAENQVFVRLGNPILAARLDGPGLVCEDTYLTCLDLSPTKEGRLTERWQIGAQRNKAEAGLFDGAPVVSEGRVFIARASFAAGRAVTAIDCYHAGTGTRLWRQPVFETVSLKETEPRYQPLMLTVSGSQVFICSQTGAVVALEALTGRRAWTLLYPTRKTTADGLPSPRDLMPPLAAGGKLFIAPADYDHILCLDQMTGALLWESEPAMEVVHLLGVAKNRVIFTTPHHLRAVDSTTGRALRDWVQPDYVHKLPSLGRGLLAGDWVLWPTVKGLRVLDQETGNPVSVPYNFTGNNDLRGNLALADGCLVTAEGQTVRGYIPESLRLDQRKQALRSKPDDLHTRLGLAVAEFEAGFLDQALDNFTQVEQSARPEDRWDGQSLVELARSKRHQTLLKRAEESAQKKNLSRAIADLEAASAEPFSSHDRCQALCRAASMWLGAEQPDKAVDVWQKLVNDGALEQARIAGPDGASRTAREHAIDQIDRLIQAHGPKVYESWEAKARKLRTLAKGAGMANVLRELIQEFPNASITPRALLDLRQLKKPQNNTSEGAAAWDLDLEPSERLLVPDSPSPGFVFVRGTALVFRNHAAGKTLWLKTLPWLPSWVHFVDELVLLGGAAGIQCLNWVDGQPLWEFAPTPGSQSELHDFRVAGARLFFLQGDRRLFALDVETGRVRWSLWPTPSQTQPMIPGPAFFPDFFAGADWLLMHTSVGERWILDSRTGKVQHRADAAAERWPTIPIPIDNQRLLVVKDLQRVTLLDLPSGKEIWTQTMPFPSVYVQPPQPITAGHNLFMLIDGWQLAEVDPETGKNLRTKNLGPGMIRLQHAVRDGAGLFFTSGHSLKSRTLDGRTLWPDVPLPAHPGPWRVQSASGRLIILPLQAAPKLPLSWLLGKNLLEPRPHTRYSFPVLIVDGQSGKTLRTLDFHSHQPEFQAQVGSSGVTIAREGIASHFPWP